MELALIVRMRPVVVFGCWLGRRLDLGNLAPHDMSVMLHNFFRR